MGAGLQPSSTTQSPWIRIAGRVQRTTKVTGRELKFLTSKWPEKLGSLHIFNFARLIFNGKRKMNSKIIDSYARLRPGIFILPLFLLTIIILLLYSQDALSVNGYILIQKDIFFSANHCLGQYAALQLNLTQLGDALIILSFLSTFFFYVPKIWESLLSGLFISLLLSQVLKEVFAIPRPAAVFDNSSFIVVGKRLVGHSSLPSGHSIIIFSVLTVLLFAFMPKASKPKIAWFFLIIVIGLTLAFTRVGIGAHYPIDVIAGSIVGYISGLTGIFISRKYNVWGWINNKKYYPVFIFLFLVCGALLVNKIITENLIIFYLALASLAFSIFKIISVYAKR